MNEAPADAGSYRDPSGRVFVLGDRVLRTVMPRAAADFEFVRSTGVLQSLIAEGSAIAEEQVDPGGLPRGFNDARYVVQHPKLPFISYPYEWCFTALKRAALLHLDIQMRCLEQGVALSDASAYNVQFLGPKPIFIDSLSFRRYREDEFWMGHKQFCEQFLNPLLLRALLGVTAQCLVSRRPRRHPDGRAEPAASPAPQAVLGRADECGDAGVLPAHGDRRQRGRDARGRTVPARRHAAHAGTAAQMDLEAAAGGPGQDRLGRLRPRDLLRGRREPSASAR